MTSPAATPLLDAEGNPWKIAVLIPCYNEETTVAAVVKDFRAALPEADIYVFDNVSTDRTAEIAREAGATVIYSGKPGKGNVVQHMFTLIEADYYLMADGDSTYPASHARLLLDAAIAKGTDMVVGRRVTPDEILRDAYRPMHRFGNNLVCGLIAASFGSGIRDVFSGYRVFSRTFVKTVPLHSRGFEIEIEMTLQALSHGYSVFEIEVPYGVRPSGSVSKLSTYRDGMLVLRSFGTICRDYLPNLFFGTLAGIFLVLSVLAGLPPILDYIQYHYVYRVPLAILAAALAILCSLSLCVGMILTSQLRYHREQLGLQRRNLQSLWKMRTPPSGK